MTNNQERPHNTSQQYSIRIEGMLGEEWASAFDGFAIRYEENTTVLTGMVVDQAALHGLLKRVRDLGLQLIAVARVDPGDDTRGAAIDE